MGAVSLPMASVCAPNDPVSGGDIVNTVEAALSQLEADSGVDDSTKDVLRPIYQEALETAKGVLENTKAAAGYRETMETGPETLESLRLRLESAGSEGGLQDFEEVDSEQLQKGMDSRRVELAGLTGELGKVTESLARLEERPLEISTRLPEIQVDLAAVQSQLNSPEYTQENLSPERIADRILFGAKLAELLSEREMLQQENFSHSIRQDLLSAQKELLDRKIESFQKILTAQSERLGERLTQEAREMTEAAGQTLPDVAANDEAGQRLVQEMGELAREFEAVVRSLKEATADEEKAASDLALLTQEHEFIREQLKLGGTGTAMADTILALQYGLPGRQVLAHRVADERARVDEARLRMLTVDQKLREQSGLEQTFSDRGSASFIPIVTTRGEVLNKLDAQYRTLIRTRAACYGQTLEYIQKVADVRTFIFESLFGMRTSPPVGIQTFAALPDGFLWFFSRAHGREMIRVFTGAAGRAPGRLAGSCLLLAALFFLRRRLSQLIAGTAIAARRISTDSYRQTMLALLCSLLLALPLPLLLRFISEWMGLAPEPSGWLRGIGRGFLTASRVGLVLSFLIVVCRDGGIGRSHFRWKEEIVQKTRHILCLFSVVILPEVILLSGTVFGGGGLHLESLGRMSFIGLILYVEILLWQLFRFDDSVFSYLIETYPDRWFVRMRHLILALLLCGPLFAAGSAWAGYLFVAGVVILDLLVILWIVAVCTVIYWLLLRGFMIKERRLALAQALEARRLRAEEAEADAESVEGEVVLIDPEEEEGADLEFIGGHARHLLRSCMIVLGLMLLIMFWDSKLPLDQLLASVPVFGSLNLLQLVWVVFLAFISAIAIRDLPSVLELMISQESRLQAGTRSAISTLGQYTAGAIGAGLILHILDVDWSKLGWIAAALSVGVGFGLQEVVANFISGLILLFERPIRVGDVVTIEGTTGTVMKIRLRATTVMNWERQELVVPNKALITNTILNWTLSASLNRVLIAVGVAYGSDTEKARKIMLEVASNHPMVLDDPSPMATFEEFAGSSLTLCLRAYLPNIESRLSTTTELHSEINKKFAQAGIVIAFPQRDLHLKTGWGESPSTGEKMVP
ncbi:putative MscS family protein.1 [Pontiella sulfatireligans]|uniref:Putative MscS family protein.1 n=2 Tax=Pontiella sulfatireligans TaxID=2750658 RepID=A0A6C2USZ5_9BACT|nr:putative MscS family protein.1 [Pontiella sulfatireligans]